MRKQAIYSEKFSRVLYSGRKRYKEFKQSCLDLLKSQANYWEQNKELLTKSDYEQRALNTGIMKVAVALYKNAKWAEEFRMSIRFRDCRYKKYLLREKSIYEFYFYSISKRAYRTNCIVIGKRIIFYKRPINIPKGANLIENGRYRYIPQCKDRYRFHLYPFRKPKYSFALMINNHSRLSIVRI